MRKSLKVARPFTAFTRRVPERWASLVRLPSFAMAIATESANAGARLPESSSALTSTVKFCPNTIGSCGGSMLNARRVASLLHATLKVVRAVSLARTLTVRGLAPSTTRQFGASPPMKTLWLPWLTPVSVTVPASA